MYRPNTSPTFVKFMKKYHNKYTFNYKKYSYKEFQKNLSRCKDREQLLRNTALSLHAETYLSVKALAFRNHFFQDHADELAGVCGCSHVLPDHMRIKNGKYQQLFIELMNSFRRHGILGDVSVPNLARMLNCSIDSPYNFESMKNRLKNNNPDYEFVDKSVEELIRLFNEIIK